MHAHSGALVSASRSAVTVSCPLGFWHITTVRGSVRFIVSTSLDPDGVLVHTLGLPEKSSVNPNHAGAPGSSKDSTRKLWGSKASARDTQCPGEMASIILLGETVSQGIARKRLLCTCLVTELLFRYMGTWTKLMFVERSRLSTAKPMLTLLALQELFGLLTG